MLKAGKRSGSTLYMVVGSTTVLFGATAWVVDLGNGYATRTHMQAAADAGVLAGSAQLASPLTRSEVQNQVVSWVGQNGFSITAANVSTWVTTAGNPAVTVRWTQPLKTTFGAAIGVPTINVGAASSAVLGGLTQIPKGFLPFAVPAYKVASGQWYVRTDINDTYLPLSMTAGPGGGPTRIMIKAGAGGSQSGNFQALAIDGTGAANYQRNIVDGVAEALQFGAGVSTVESTEPGNMVGPTAKGIGDRLAKGAAWADVYVPMIAKSEWDTLHGRSTVTVIGFVNARLEPVTTKGEVFADFVSKTVPLPGSLSANLSPGAFAPILIPTP